MASYFLDQHPDMSDEEYHKIVVAAARGGKTDTTKGMMFSTFTYMEELAKERDEARDSFEILYRALCDYGKHRITCMCQSIPSGRVGCDCGFGSTLSAAAKNIEKWTEEK